MQAQDSSENLILVNRPSELSKSVSSFIQIGRDASICDRGGKDHECENAEHSDHVNIGSPSHFRGVWASPAPRREAPRGRTTPRLPVNDWGNVLLACTCVTSHATYKKKRVRMESLPARSL